jgi:hypothetical protein
MFVLKMENIIESFEYFEYRPPISQDYNQEGSEFSISLLNEDVVTQPSKSLLVVQGVLSVVKDTSVATSIDVDKIHFVNNGPLHLFDRIDYYIGDAKIDTIRKLYFLNLVYRIFPIIMTLYFMRVRIMFRVYISDSMKKLARTRRLGF